MRLLPLLMCVLLIAACSRTTEPSTSTPPDYLEVTGIGDAQGQGGGPANWSQSMGAAIAASAEADLRANATPEKLMAARATARRAALRKIAERLESAPLDAKTKLRDWLAGAPASQRIAFENLIEGRATVAWREKGGKSIAVASIPTDAVAAWMMEQARSGAGGDEATIKQRAYNLAVENAKAKLRKQLLDMDAGDGRTLAKAIESDPQIGERLDAILHVVPVDEVSYPRVGVCQVKIFFDKNVARGLAAGSHRRWGIF